MNYKGSGEVKNKLKGRYEREIGGNDEIEKKIFWRFMYFVFS